MRPRTSDKFQYINFSKVATLLLIILALPSLSGCGRLFRWRVKPPPPVVKPIPEFTEIPLPDLASVAGHRILLDPGHGGPQPGAVAPANGLRESDVNLRVALRSRELLRGAGASVTLTRTEDTALDPENTSRDLALRAELATPERTDVFVSVHHNADIAPNSERNDLEVYYKVREDHASLDLAQCLTWELAARLRRDAAAKLLLPGNYKVLRLSSVPAVLLESSYLTNPDNASLLATNQAIDSEAKAIAAGIARYFALDPPAGAQVDVRTLDAERTLLLDVTLERGLPISPDSVEVYLDRKPSAGYSQLTDRGFRWTFREPVPNGRHEAQIVARNTRGASLSHVLSFDVARTPTHVFPRCRPEAIPTNSNLEVLVEARVLDALGLSVADGTPVTLEPPRLESPTHDGVARFYVRAGQASAGFQLKAGAATADTTLVHGTTPYKTVRFVHALTQAPIPNVLVSIPPPMTPLPGDQSAIHNPQSTIPDVGTYGESTPQGWLCLPADLSRIAVSRDGYIPATIDLLGEQTRVSLVPIADGILDGKRILLDPANGGRDIGMDGPTGLRACDVNLDVARQVAAELRRAGAEVFLTRTGDEELTDLQRVIIAEDVQAELVIAISFGAPDRALKMLGKDQRLKTSITSAVGHYPESPFGKRLADSIADQLGVRVMPCVAYLVQQTSCPAVLVFPASVADEKTERRLRTTATRSELANAIYGGILQYFSQD